MQSTMAWRFEGRLVVAVHAEASPSKGEWQRFLNDAARVGVNSRFRLLVVSYGGGPDGEQRRLLTEIMHRDHPTMAMLTESKLIRALMFAFSVINRTSKCLGLQDAESAFDFLGLDGEERQAALRIRRELETELGRAPKDSASDSAPRQKLGG